MKSKLQKIHLYATHALVIAVIWILEASVRVHAELPTLPKLPDITTPTDNPIDYMIGAIKYVVAGLCALIVVGAIIIFAGGIVSELSQARQRGEWGKFGGFIAAGLVVILLVMAACWWSGKYLGENLT